MDRWHMSGDQDRCIPRVGRIRIAVFPLSGGHGSWPASARTRLPASRCRRRSCPAHGRHFLRCADVRRLAWFRASALVDYLAVTNGYLTARLTCALLGLGGDITSRIRDRARPHWTSERVWHLRDRICVPSQDAQAGRWRSRTTARSPQRQWRAAEIVGCSRVRRDITNFRDAASCRSGTSTMSVVSPPKDSIPEPHWRHVFAS